MAKSTRNKLLLSLSITAALAHQSVRSQTVTAPAVNVVRNPALSGAVWPGDFNGDGETDLLATDPSRDAPVLIVAIGSGTGSFGSPIKSSFQGAALAVGDFNGDGKLDAIAASQSALFVLPGNGNGTFATARKIADDTQVQFAVVADLDGDGKRDLIVSSEGGGFRIHPGNGDFTFDPPI